MPFHLELHSADYRIHVWSATSLLEDLWKEVVRSLACLQMDLLEGDLPWTAPEYLIQVEVKNSPDLDILLVDVLNELLRFSVQQKRIFWKILELQVNWMSGADASAERWSAHLRVGGNTPPDGWARDIKAVTYHDLLLWRTPEDQAWHFRYVVDV